MPAIFTRFENPAHESSRPFTHLTDLLALPSNLEQPCHGPRLQQTGSSGVLRPGGRAYPGEINRSAKVAAAGRASHGPPGSHAMVRFFCQSTHRQRHAVYFFVQPLLDPTRRTPLQLVFWRQARCRDQSTLSSTVSSVLILARASRSRASRKSGTSFCRREALPVVFLGVSLGS